TVSSGTLRLGASGVIPDSSAVTANGTLDLNNFSETIGSLSGTGTVASGSATLTIGANNQSTTFGGVINGTGGLTKVGTGSQFLNGTNTYTGLTSVTAGLLGGTGTIGNVTVGLSGSITPGIFSGAGILNTGNLSLGGTSGLDLDFFGTSPGTG